jgi:hypothetical protein
MGRRSYLQIFVFLLTLVALVAIRVDAPSAQPSPCNPKAQQC